MNNSSRSFGRLPAVATVVLSTEEEVELATRWRTLGDAKALDRLICSCMRLVVHIAQGYRQAGPPLEDLIQEGYVGLVIAARKFDPSRRTRLATHATYWIRAFMLKHIVRTFGPVRIGTSRADLKIFFNLGKTRRKLAHDGEEAEALELARALDVKKHEIENMQARLSRCDVSFDAPFSHNDERAFGSRAAFLANGSTPEEMVAEVEEQHWTKQCLARALSTLRERERIVIEQRYLREETRTLESIGRELGVSRERIRQIETTALTKLNKRWMKLPM